MGAAPRASPWTMRGFSQNPKGWRGHTVPLSPSPRDEGGWGPKGAERVRSSSGGQAAGGGVLVCGAPRGLWARPPPLGEGAQQLGGDTSAPEPAWSRGAHRRDWGEYGGSQRSRGRRQQEVNPPSQEPLTLSLQVPTKCEPGCVCAKGLYENASGQCVPPEECPCEFAGVSYPRGAELHTDCKTW